MQALADLTLPLPGSTTARSVWSLALARALRDLVPALHPRRARSAERRRELTAVCERFVAVSRADPGALSQALRRPTVSTLLRCLRGLEGPNPGDSALAFELAATLALELAAASALGGRIELAVPAQAPARLCCLGLDASFELPAGARRIAFEDGSCAWSDGRARHALPLVRPSAGLGHAPRPEGGLALGYAANASSTRALRLGLCDNNPLAGLEAHPDKAGSGLDLGGHSPAAWLAALDAARALVALALPEIQRDLELCIAIAIPVGYFADRHLSASYREALGIIYLSLHPSPLTMAEALVHELQHNKLNALFEHDAVLEDDDAPRFPSARRPDLRPLRGVLLALHAFAPVEHLYRTLAAAEHPLLADEGARARLDTITRGNRADLATLEGALRPTALGAELLAELGRLARQGDAFAAPAG